MDYFKIDLKKVNTSLYDFQEISDRMNTAVDDVISIRNDLRNKICNSDGIGDALKRVENSMMAQSAQILSLGGTLESVLEHYNSAENNIIGNNNEHIGDSFVNIGSIDLRGSHMFGKSESFSDSYNSDQTYYRSNDTVYIAGGSGYVEGFSSGGDPVDHFINTYLEPTGKTVGIVSKKDEYTDAYGNKFYKDSEGNLYQSIPWWPDKKINVEYMDSDQLENLMAMKKENTKTKSNSSNNNSRNSRQRKNDEHVYDLLDKIYKDSSEKTRKDTNNNPKAMELHDEFLPPPDDIRDLRDAIIDGDEEAGNRAKEKITKDIANAIKEDLK